jgi:peptide deformylase
VVNDKVRKFIDDMFDTMYDAPGIGLAAPQVDRRERIIVIDISEDRSRPLCFINPEILSCDGEEVMEEGCLSVPTIYEKVKRANYVKVKYLDREGRPAEMEAEGVLAVCIQHEIDHLEGKLFVDHLSSLKKNRVLKKLEKNRRHTL